MKFLIHLHIGIGIFFMQELHRNVLVYNQYEVREEVKMIFIPLCMDAWKYRICIVIGFSGETAVFFKNISTFSPKRRGVFLKCLSVFGKTWRRIYIHFLRLVQLYKPVHPKYPFYGNRISKKSHFMEIDFEEFAFLWK